MFKLPSIKRIIIFCIVFLILFILFIAGEIYLPRSADNQELKIVIIDRGMGAGEIGEVLEQEKIIRSGLFFRLYVYIFGTSGDLWAGKYKFSPSQSIPDIVEDLVSGFSIVEKITVIEGWNLRDIADLFEQKGMFSKEDFYRVAGSPLTGFQENSDFRDFSQKYDFLRDIPTNVSLEGFLFPETYYFTTRLDEEGNSIEEVVIEKMLQIFNQKVNRGEGSLGKEISRQGKSVYEIITMASLIEKEVRTMEDKKLVSGILWKRLKVGMPLQVDATVRYATGKESPRVSIQDTKIDSLYNTYKYKGLPRGPICNPGLESIEAALYPEESEFWYYLSTPEGKTIFSKTLLEHNIAVARYLK